MRREMLDADRDSDRVVEGRRDYPATWDAEFFVPAPQDGYGL
jgi:hypothetical protein